MQAEDLFVHIEIQIHKVLSAGIASKNGIGCGHEKFFIFIYCPHANIPTQKFMALDCCLALYQRPIVYMSSHLHSICSIRKSAHLG